jgi:hypothetical protein
MKTKTIRATIIVLLLDGCFDPPPTVADDETGASDASDGASSDGSSGGASSQGTTTSTSNSTGVEGSDGMDEGSESGHPEQPVPRPTTIMQTSGGGRVSSTAFFARLRIGAPQPAGRSSSPLHDAHLGPGSVQ